MVKQTPRLGLDDYAPGDENWDHSDLVNEVDEKAVQRGPIADRPTSGDYDDELYYATDQGLFWRWDSNISDWVTDSVGTSSQPVPGTSHFNAANINGQDGVGVGTSSSVAPGFGTWVQVSSSRPAYVQVEVSAQTDGTSDGEVRIEVDESGGTTTDYFLRVGYASASLGSGVTAYDQAEVLLPAGAQYLVTNYSDPNAANTIETTREYVL